VAGHIFFLEFGEAGPEGAYVIRQTVLPDGKVLPLSFEAVGRAIVEAHQKGHELVFVEAPPLVKE
jgi:hypothetical protein